MEQGSREGSCLGLSSVSLAHGPGAEAATTVIKLTVEVTWEGGVSIRELARPLQCRKELAGRSSELPPGGDAASVPGERGQQAGPEVSALASRAGIKPKKSPTFAGDYKKVGVYGSGRGLGRDLCFSGLQEHSPLSPSFP